MAKQKPPKKKAKRKAAKAAKRPRGRPSIYSAELAETICARLVGGESLRQICEDDKMPCSTTVLRWLVEKDDFQAQYAQACELQAERFQATRRRRIGVCTFRPKATGGSSINVIGASRRVRGPGQNLRPHPDRWPGTHPALTKAHQTHHNGSYNAYPPSRPAAALPPFTYGVDSLWCGHSPKGAPGHALARRVCSGRSSLQAPDAHATARCPSGSNSAYAIFLNRRPVEFHPQSRGLRDLDKAIPTSGDSGIVCSDLG